MKRNSACRVHSDLGYLSLSQPKPGQRMADTQDLHSASLGSCGRPTWADPAGYGLISVRSSSSSCVRDLEHGANPIDCLLLSWKAFPGFENKEGICSWLRCSAGKGKLKHEPETGDFFCSPKPLKNKTRPFLVGFFSFSTTCRLDAPYCSSWTGGMVPLPMTSLVLVASFWE